MEKFDGDNSVDNSDDVSTVVADVVGQQRPRRSTYSTTMKKVSFMARRLVDIDWKEDKRVTKTISTPKTVEYEQHSSPGQDNNVVSGVKNVSNATVDDDAANTKKLTLIKPVEAPAEILPPNVSSASTVVSSVKNVFNPNVGKASSSKSSKKNAKSTVSAKVSHLEKQTVLEPITSMQILHHSASTVVSGVENVLNPNVGKTPSSKKSAKSTVCEKPTLSEPITSVPILHSNALTVVSSVENVSNPTVGKTRSSRSAKKNANSYVSAEVSHLEKPNLIEPTIASQQILHSNASPTTVSSVKTVLNSNVDKAPCTSETTEDATANVCRPKMSTLIEPTVASVQIFSPVPSTVGHRKLLPLRIVLKKPIRKQTLRANRAKIISKPEPVKTIKQNPSLCQCADVSVVKKRRVNANVGKVPADEDAASTSTRHWKEPRDTDSGSKPVPSGKRRRSRVKTSKMVEPVDNLQSAASAVVLHNESSSATGTIVENSQLERSSIDPNFSNNDTSLPSENETVAAKVNDFQTESVFDEENEMIVEIIEVTSTVSDENTSYLEQRDNLSNEDSISSADYVFAAEPSERIEIEFPETSDVATLNTEHSSVIANEQIVESDNPSNDMQREEDLQPMPPTESRVQCEVCGLQFTSTSLHNLKKHMYTHTGDEPFSCKFCNLAFTRSDKLRIHHAKFHSDKRQQKPNKKMFQVGKCGKTNLKMSRKATNENGHKSASKVWGEKPFVCKLCDLTFARNASLKNHHQICHPNEEPDKKMFQSKKFDKVSDKMLQFQNAITQNHCESTPSEKPFACKLCDLTFARSASLKNHHEICHPNEERSTEVAKPDKMTFQLRKPDKNMLQRRNATKLSALECLQCGRVLNNRVSYRRHVQVHTGEKPFSCKLCDRTFSRTDRFKEHLSQHASDKPCSCKICKISFSSEHGLKIHERRVHHGEERAHFFGKVSNAPVLSTTNLVVQNPDDLSTVAVEEPENVVLQSWEESTKNRPRTNAAKSFSCEICNKKFRFKCLLFAHKTLHTGKRPFACRFCSENFRTKGLIKVHLLKHHSNEAPEEINRLKIIKLNEEGDLLQTSSLKLPFTCDTCRKSFCSKDALKDHKRIHSGERPFICNVCGEAFRLKQNLKCHILRRHPDDSVTELAVLFKSVKTEDLQRYSMQYTCEICGKQFLFERFLTHHLLRCSAKDDLKEIRVMKNIKPNYKKEIGAKPFPCEICGKQFRFKSILFTHKISHTDVRPYVCRCCGKGFRSKRNIELHLLNFHLKQAHKEFRRLKNVVLNSEGGLSRKELKRPISCETCGKTFSFLSQLKIHEFLHTDEFPFVCRSCGKGYHQMTNLRYHISKRHPAESAEELIPLCKVPRKEAKDEVIVEDSDDDVMLSEYRNAISNCFVAKEEIVDESDDDVMLSVYKEKGLKD